MSSLFLLVSFLITLLLAASVCIQGQQTETVKDSDGNPVEIGEQYFIQPVNNGGPLVPVPLSLFSFCPLGITQIPLPFIWGPPVSFGNIWSGSTETIVRKNTQVTIEYKSNNWPVCSELSKFWQVNGTIGTSSEPAILVGGNPSTPICWFHIKPAGTNIYELASLSGRVGTKPGPLFGTPQLVLTKDNAKTLFVKFQKLGGTTTSTPLIETGLKMFPF